MNTFWVGYLNEVQLRLQFGKSLDIQISSLVGSFKKTNSFFAHFVCSHELFMINDVCIKVFGKLKMAFFFLTLAKLRLNNWPFKFKTLYIISNHRPPEYKINS